MVKNFFASGSRVLESFPSNTGKMENVKVIGAHLLFGMNFAIRNAFVFIVTFIESEFKVGEVDGKNMFETFVYMSLVLAPATGCRIASGPFHAPWWQYRWVGPRVCCSKISGCMRKDRF